MIGSLQPNALHLDRLHKDGVRLTNFHVDPVCAPTRAALMTGRYSRRAGVWNVVGSPSILPDGETTMGDLFTKAGYRAAIFGKWHLGDNYPYRPEDRGFEEVITMGGGVVGHTPDYWLNDYFDDTYRHNGRWKRFPGYCTDVWFDHAIEFARTSGDQPFFIYLPVSAPHTPLQVPASYKKPYAGQSEEIQRFYGMIANIDQNVGRLRTELRKAGLERNTILIFMTDNGTTHSEVYNAGMRGQKGCSYEGGHRVPCLIHWPGGQIVGGRDVDRLTAHFDLMPTLASLCGLHVPEELHFDGRDLTPLLRDPDVAWEDRTLFVEWQGVIKPQKWKRSCVMTQRWRLINGRELYDMETGPDQSKNVAPAHPEVVTRLRSEYERWWNKVGSRDDILREIPVGAAAEPSVRLTAYDWITRTGRQQDMPWGQIHIVKGPLQNGCWALRVERDGDYRIRLRRWPVESGLAINDTTDVVPPEKSWHPVESAVLKAIRARITIQDIDRTHAVAETNHEAVFDVRLKAGSTRLQTWFYDQAERSRGAYYVHVQYRGSGSPNHQEEMKR
ncbi:MAG: arylsulfatase [Luteolibacter sp.]